MLIFFDFSDNQNQTDYAQQRGKLCKPAHNPIYAVLNGMLKEHIYSNGVTENTQTNRCAEALFEQFFN